MNVALGPDELEQVRVWMNTGVRDKVMMERLGVSQPTITRAKKKLRAQTAKRIADIDGMYRETLERFQQYEQMALEKGSIREARENRTAIMRLLGLAKAERHALEVTGAGGAPIATRTEIVVVDPQPRAVTTPLSEPALDTTAVLPMIVAVDPQCPPQS